LGKTALKITDGAMKNLKGKDFLGIGALNHQELQDLLDLASDLKMGKRAIACDKTLGLLFYKASTRTRVSFTVAMISITLRGAANFSDRKF